jgi:hypothetical protein
VHAQAVPLPDRHTGDEAVPDPVGDVRQLEPALRERAVRLEKAQLHALGVGGDDRHVDATCSRVYPERVRA